MPELDSSSLVMIALILAIVVSLVVAILDPWDLQRRDERRQTDAVLDQIRRGSDPGGGSWLV